MSQLSSPPHDTWIQPLPFAAADDRRQSARVPTALKVRLGPAREPPSTTLLCEDVSEGGLFVRCGQAVQLGARFSVELTLASGDVLYIPEAEVLYNVDGEGARKGFGARFVAVTREAKQKLLDVARFSSEIQPRRDVSGSMIVGNNDRTTSRMRRAKDERAKDEEANGAARAGAAGAMAAGAANANATVMPSRLPSAVHAASGGLHATVAPEPIMPRVSDLRVATLRPGVGLVVPNPVTTRPVSAPSAVVASALLADDAEDGELHGGVTIQTFDREVAVGHGADVSVHDTLLPTDNGFTALGVSSDLSGASQVMSAPPLAEDDESYVDGGTLPPLGTELDGQGAPARASKPKMGGLIMGAGGALVAGVLLAAYLGSRDAPAGASAPERIPGRVSGSIAGALAAPRSGADVVVSPTPLAAKPGAKPGALSKLDAAAGAGSVEAAVEAKAMTKAAPVVLPVAGKGAQPEKAAAPEKAAKAEKPKDGPQQTWKEALVGTPAPKPAEVAKAEAAQAKADAEKAAAAAREDLDDAMARLDQPAVAAKPAAASKPAIAAVPASVRPLTLDVAAGTKVIRTHVLREPARFVVDLDTTALPKSAVARIGRHDGFVRVVVDAPAALSGGTAVVKGERLVIELTPR